jgi:hypothetical protein
MACATNAYYSAGNEKKDMNSKSSYLVDAVTLAVALLFKDELLLPLSFLSSSLNLYPRSLSFLRLAFLTLPVRY